MVVLYAEQRGSCQGWFASHRSVHCIPFPLSGNLTVVVSGRGVIRPTFNASLELLCPGGTFSTTGRPVNGSCSGLCAVGYACPAGSTNGTAVQCLGGTFGQPGLARCPTFDMANRCVQLGSAVVSFVVH